MMYEDVEYSWSNVSAEAGGLEPSTTSSKTAGPAGGISSSLKYEIEHDYEALLNFATEIPLGEEDLMAASTVDTNLHFGQPISQQHRQQNW